MMIEAGALLMLAVYALLRHRGADSLRLAGMLAFAGVGAVVFSLWEWAGVFLLIIAWSWGIALFNAHRREVISPIQKLTAVALLLLTPISAGLLSEPEARGIIGFQGLVLGGMAGLAWTSTFPRFRAGLGAVMVVFGELFALAELGPLAGASWAGLAAWLLFYFGLFLLAIGVSGELQRRGVIASTGNRKMKPTLRVVQGGAVRKDS